ncbi:hypothetical protein JTB14_031421 [Gonioctena quinquepunctata]|nr:hypothetical protein JTB14_031421 [Gonioctena quinquepunctata]
MNRRPLNEAELEKIAARFRETDSEDDVPDTFREEDRDLSEHSDHEYESEIRLGSDAEMEQEPDDAEMEQKSDDAEMEQESDEAEMEQEQESGSGNYYYGRNGYKWSKNPPAPSRIRRSNIIHLPGTRGAVLATKPNTPLGAWSLLFTERLIDLVVDHTNQKIMDLCLNYGNLATFVNHVDKTELKALLGLMLLWGVFKSGHEDISSLFATDGTGRDIFRATISEQRCLFLSSA